VTSPTTTDGERAGLPLSVPGLYGWEAGFEALLDALAARLGRLVPAGEARFVRFPPLLPRATIDRVGYRDAFPHLLGDVTVWDADAQAAEPAPVVLAPAACYHVYPLARAVQPASGECFEVESWCHRNEAGEGAARLRAFRMREFVKLGAADVVAGWREGWIERMRAFARALGLDADVAPASDPFFGARGRLLAHRQRSAELKHELLAPLATGERIAIASVNLHQAHFGELFGIALEDGAPAHSACAAFGLERFAAALIARHGAGLDAWPSEAREALAG